MPWEGQGVTRLVHQINQMVHLLAAGLWLGSLVPLAGLLGRARSTSETGWIYIARDAVPRFSQMGYAAVALLAASGALNTGRHTLRPTAGSEDPVVPGNGHCRAVQPFSPAAALAAGSTSLSGGGRSHSLGSL